MALRFDGAPWIKRAARRHPNSRLLKTANTFILHSKISAFIFSSKRYVFLLVRGHTLRIPVVSS